MTTTIESMIGHLRAAWVARTRRERTLILRESLGLGERRFVAVIECDGRRFLIGGGKESVQLISALSEERPS